MIITEVYEAQINVDSEMSLWTRNLESISFVSKTIGWGIGSGQVLFTQDAGDNWVNLFKDDNIIPYSHAHRIFCVTEQECWIPGFFKNECCYTKDCGKSWNVKKMGDNIYPKDIFFLNSSFGWIIGNEGGYKSKKAEIHLTKDGGITWGRTFLNLIGMPIKLLFINELCGWVLDNFLANDEDSFESNLYYTKDSGRTWKRVTNFNKQILDFTVINDKKLIVVGENGFISCSSNGGKTWSNHEYYDVNINAINFLGEDVGLAVCDRGKIIYTETGGEKWIEIKNRIPDDFISVVLTDIDQGFISSSHSIYSFAIE